MPDSGSGQPPELRDDAERSRYEMDVGDGVAFLEYRRRKERLHLMHTEVPPAFRGRGAGARLVRAVLERARVEGAVVVPHCPFVKRFIDEHPEYSSLVRQPKHRP